MKLAKLDLEEFRDKKCSGTSGTGGGWLDPTKLALDDLRDSLKPDDGSMPALQSVFVLVAFVGVEGVLIEGEESAFDGFGALTFMPPLGIFAIRSGYRRADRGWGYCAKLMDSIDRVTDAANLNCLVLVFMN